MDLPPCATLFTAAASLQQLTVDGQPGDLSWTPRRTPENDNGRTTKVLDLCSNSGDAQEMLALPEIGNAPVGLDAPICLNVVQWGGRSLLWQSGDRSGLITCDSPAYPVPECAAWLKLERAVPAVDAVVPGGVRCLAVLPRSSQAGVMNFVTRSPGFFAADMELVKDVDDDECDSDGYRLAIMLGDGTAGDTDRALSSPRSAERHSFVCRFSCGRVGISRPLCSTSSSSSTCASSSPLAASSSAEPAAPVAAGAAVADAGGAASGEPWFEIGLLAGSRGSTEKTTNKQQSESLRDHCRMNQVRNLVSRVSFDEELDGYATVVVDENSNAVNKMGILTEKCVRDDGEARACIEQRFSEHDVRNEVWAQADTRASSAHSCDKGCLCGACLNVRCLNDGPLHVACLCNVCLNDGCSIHVGLMADRPHVRRAVLGHTICTPSVLAGMVEFSSMSAIERSTNFESRDSVTLPKDELGMDPGRTDPGERSSVKPATQSEVFGLVIAARGNREFVVGTIRTRHLVSETELAAGKRAAELGVVESLSLVRKQREMVSVAVQRRDSVIVPREPRHLVLAANRSTLKHVMRFGVFVTGERRDLVSVTMEDLDEVSVARDQSDSVLAADKPSRQGRLGAAIVYESKLSDLAEEEDESDDLFSPCVILKGENLGDDSSGTCSRRNESEIPNQVTNERGQTNLASCSSEVVPQKLFDFGTLPRCFTCQVSGGCVERTCCGSDAAAQSVLQVKAGIPEMNRQPVRSEAGNSSPSWLVQSSADGMIAGMRSVGYRPEGNVVTSGSIGPVHGYLSQELEVSGSMEPSRDTAWTKSATHFEGIIKPRDCLLAFLAPDLEQNEGPGPCVTSVTDELVPTLETKTCDRTCIDGVFEPESYEIVTQQAFKPAVNGYSNDEISVCSSSDEDQPHDRDLTGREDDCLPEALTGHGNSDRERDSGMLIGEPLVAYASLQETEVYELFPASTGDKAENDICFWQSVLGGLVFAALLGLATSFKKNVSLRLLIALSLCHLVVAVARCVSAQVGAARFMNFMYPRFCCSACVAFEYDSLEKVSTGFRWRVRRWITALKCLGETNGNWSGASVRDRADHSVMQVRVDGKSEPFLNNGSRQGKDSDKGCDDFFIPSPDLQPVPGSTADDSCPPSADGGILADGAVDVGIPDSDSVPSLERSMDCGFAASEVPDGASEVSASSVFQDSDVKIGRSSEGSDLWCADMDDSVQHSVSVSCLHDLQVQFAEKQARTEIKFREQVASLRAELVQMMATQASTFLVEAVKARVEVKVAALLSAQVALVQEATVAAERGVDVRALLEAASLRPQGREFCAVPAGCGRHEHPLRGRRQICRFFNLGDGACRVMNCSFAHVCKICRSNEHHALNCPLRVHVRETVQRSGKDDVNSCGNDGHSSRSRSRLQAASTGSVGKRFAEQRARDSNVRDEGQSRMNTCLAAGNSYSRSDLLAWRPVPKQRGIHEERASLRRHVDESQRDFGKAHHPEQVETETSIQQDTGPVCLAGGSCSRSNESGPPGLLRQSAGLSQTLVSDPTVVCKRVGRKVPSWKNSGSEDNDANDGVSKPRRQAGDPDDPDPGDSDFGEHPSSRKPGGPGWPIGSSGSGNQDKFCACLLELVARLVKAEERRAELEEQAARRKIEEVFKICPKLPEIRSDDPAKAIEALERFEIVLTDAHVRERSMWVTLFRHQLRGDAKSWVEASLCRDPGMSLMRTAKESDDPQAWDEIYAHLRMRLLSIGILQIDEIREKAKTKWRRTKMTGKRDADAIQHSIIDITEAWKEMVKYEEFQDTPASREQLMRDLRNKIPLGSDMKLFMGSKEYEPNSFDQWVAMVQDFQACCPTGRQESTKRAGADEHGVDTDKEAPRSPWDFDFSCDSEDDTGSRVWPVRKKDGRVGSLFGTVGNDILTQVPRCNTCGGRHRVKNCPTDVAHLDETWYLMARRSGMSKYCDYVDAVRRNGGMLVCGGVGHCRRHHEQTVAQAANRPGKRSRRKQNGKPDEAAVIQHHGEDGPTEVESSPKLKSSGEDLQRNVRNGTMMQFDRKNWRYRRALQR